MRIMLRAVLAVLMGICIATATERETLAQLGGTAPATSWQVDRKPDPISGAGANAWVLATRVTARAGKLPRPAALQILCFKKEAVIRLQFGERVGSNRSATLAYRFDEKPGRDANVRFLSDYKTIVIEEKADVVKFAGELAAADTLIVSIDSLVIGKTNAAFPVRGALAAMEAAFAQCPLPAAKRKTSQKRPLRVM